MIDFKISLRRLRRPHAALALALGLSTGAGAQTPTPAAAARVLNGDWIVAVVNSEVVTHGEVERRMAAATAEARRKNQTLPAEAELRRQVLDVLIDERVVVTYARDSGVRVEDAQVSRAIANIARQNQLTPEQLSARLRAEGLDPGRFMADIRDQMMVERVREGEVVRRIEVSEQEIDDWLTRRRQDIKAEDEVNVAQVLIPVPEGADAATVADAEKRAEAALARAKQGENFAALARELSSDANRERGGELGLRPVSRLPDLFVRATSGLGSGDVAQRVVRSGAGLHVLKVIERKSGVAQATQTHARHVLLRPSTELPVELAARRLAEYREQIAGGQRRFEDVARQVSEDGSAEGGGDLGWVTPGMMVPEFEEAMNRLPAGGLSGPVQSRFGIHLIQVLERRQVEVTPAQLREQALNALRETKFDSAYDAWAADLRQKAYIELREAPQ